MAQHAVLYRSATPATANFASLNIVPGAGDIVTNNQFLPPTDMDLLYAIAMGATLSEARIQTPLLLQTASLHLNSFVVAAVLGSNPNFADYTDWPVRFRRTENVNVQVSTTGAGETDNAMLFFGIPPYTSPALIYGGSSARRIRVHFTGSVAATAGAWSILPIVFDETLPNATFHIVNFSVVSATGILARLSIPGWAPGGFNLHPGIPVLNSVANRLPDPFYNWHWGEIGTFTNQALPLLELFATAADATQQGWMDLIVTGFGS